MSPTYDKTTILLDDKNWSTWRTFIKGRLMGKGLIHTLLRHSSSMTTVERTMNRDEFASRAIPDQLVHPPRQPQIHQGNRPREGVPVHRSHEPRLAPLEGSPREDYHYQQNAAPPRTDFHPHGPRTHGRGSHGRSSHGRSSHGRGGRRDQVNYAHTYDRYKQDDLFTVEEVACTMDVDADDPFHVCYSAMDDSANDDGWTYMDRQSRVWELVDDEKEAYLTVMEATLPPTPTPLATNWKPDYKLTQSVDDLDAELEYVFNQMDLAAACSDDQANHVDSAAPSHLQGPSLIMDSGASSHMTGDLSLLHDVKECRRSVNLADGHTISVKAMGQLRVQSNTTGKTAVFQETLHVPTLRKTPLSISQLTRENPHAQVVFHGNTMDIMIGPDVSIQAATTNSLYELDASVLLPSTPDVGSVYLVAIEATSIWHARLGYPPAASTQAILKATHGGPSQLLHPDRCDGCVRGKTTEVAHPRYGERGP
ncbi:hypothetical protein DYB28_006282 [Aphanomyces astaci]|uniref:Retrovirus-related Pol polyprotein from transposon TNT 1-94-like beta-barrel domain-containing protein n=1 Tax=Aphanomyces astaci TaxID=112090 RepID=A0A397D489_APHAT|nr:hypothetical protein DYB38_002160 [Aphanomyces astaci]RHZ17643.1 hypothetical protein DYB31_011465 [Aphanomyces astaci]RHZ24218.1 hypothetical protein DYB26_010592 [Aphanomyces astaci]RLO07665.1 hypothetical protein DYB28_006282 [Aphanomyces astaci]